MEICKRDDEFKARILPRPNGLRFDGLIKPSGRDKDDYRTGLNVRPDQNEELKVATQCLKAKGSNLKINSSSFFKN